MRAISRLGELVCAQADEVRHAAALIGAIAWTGLQPRQWLGPARSTLARQPSLRHRHRAAPVRLRAGGVRRHGGGGATRFLDRRHGAIATARPFAGIGRRARTRASRWGTRGCVDAGGPSCPRKHPGNRVSRTVVIAAGSAPSTASNGLSRRALASQSALLVASSRTSAWMLCPPEV